MRDERYSEDDRFADDWCRSRIRGGRTIAEFDAYVIANKHVTETNWRNLVSWAEECARDGDFPGAAAIQDIGLSSENLDFAQHSYGQLAVPNTVIDSGILIYESEGQQEEEVFQVEEKEEAVLQTALEEMNQAVACAKAKYEETAQLHCEESAKRKQDIQQNHDRRKHLVLCVDTLRKLRAEQQWFLPSSPSTPSSPTSEPPSPRSERPAKSRREA